MKRMLIGTMLVILSIVASARAANYILGNGGEFSRADSNGIKICNMDITFYMSEDDEQMCSIGGFRYYEDPEDEETYLSEGLSMRGIVTIDENHKVICVGESYSMLRPVTEKAEITEHANGTIDVKLSRDVTFGEYSEVECTGLKKSRN